MTTSPAALVERLVAAHRGGTAVAIDGWVPPDVDTAFTVQDHVAKAMGGIAGWKVGAPAPAAPALFAPIVSGRIWQAGAAAIAVPARYAVEIEIAVVIGRAFPAAASPPSATDALAAVSKAHIALELCATRLTDWPKAPPMLNIADNQANYGLVLGPVVADWRGIDAGRLHAVVEAGGKVLGDTTGGHAHKGLADLVVAQIGHCVTRRGGMPAGTVITTGSWTGIHWLDAPTRVTGRFDGLGEISVDLRRA